MVRQDCADVADFDHMVHVIQSVSEAELVAFNVFVTFPHHMVKLPSIFL